MNGSNRWAKKTEIITCMWWTVLIIYCKCVRVLMKFETFSHRRFGKILCLLNLLRKKKLEKEKKKKRGKSRRNKTIRWIHIQFGSNNSEKIHEINSRALPNVYIWNVSRMRMISLTAYLFSRIHLKKNKKKELFVQWIGAENFNKLGSFFSWIEGTQKLYISFHLH